MNFMKYLPFLGIIAISIIPAFALSEAEIMEKYRRCDNEAWDYEVSIHERGSVTEVDYELMRENYRACKAARDKALDEIRTK